MSPEVRRVLDKLDNVKATAGGWMARCPAHKDGRPSLKVDLADDGRVLLKCYAGCEATAIVEAMGLELSDLFPPKAGETRARGRRVERTEYPVRDETGALIGTHVRDVFESGEKSVWWKWPGGKDQARPMADMPLYGIDELNGARAVVVTEGERARDALKGLKIAAVGTVTGAASSPGVDALRPIVGRLVVLWADRDAAGDAHMARLAKTLKDLGQDTQAIRQLCWDDAPPGGDAADWSGDRRDILALIETAGPWPFSSNGTHDPDEGHSADEPGGNDIHLTDLGNARRLVRAHGDDLRYCKAFGKWFVWDGSRFGEDATDEVVRRAKSVVMAMYPELATLAGKERDALYKHASRSEAQRSLIAMLASAQSEPGIPVLPDDLDRDPWLATALNGTLDLRTGELGPFRRELLMTKRLACAFDPAATCPTWEAFLRQIMAGNEDLIGFIQRAAGYSLTGLTSERKLFILHGTGKNGKSTMLEVVRSILGDYARSTPAETLMAQRHEQVPHDIARLVGIRFVTAVEADEDKRFAEAKIKQLTGGDTVSARHFYAALFDFVPTFKLWLATNHKPDVRGTDEAIWDRLRLIPFAVRIPDDEQDPNLKRTLLAEASGILAWMVRGCLDWQRNGLQEPDEVKAATRRYRTETDVLGRFIADRCFVGDNAIVTAKAIYQEYGSWCEENGERQMSQTWFGRRLDERGFVRDRARTGMFYRGVGLLSDAEKDGA